MRKLIIYESIFLIVLIALAAFATVGSYNTADRENLCHEYDLIKQPSQAQQITCTILRQNQNYWINSDYVYPQMKSNDIIRYYDNYLTQNGWLRIKYNVGYGMPFFAYTKNNFILVLGVHRNEHWTITLHYRNPEKIYEPQNFLHLIQ